MVKLRTEFVYFSGGEIVSFFPSWLTPGGNSSCSSTWDFVLALITDTTCFFRHLVVKVVNLLRCQLLSLKI